MHSTLVQNSYWVTCDIEDDSPYPRIPMEMRWQTTKQEIFLPEIFCITHHSWYDFDLNWISSPTIDNSTEYNKHWHWWSHLQWCWANTHLRGWIFQGGRYTLDFWIIIINNHQTWLHYERYFLCCNRDTIKHKNYNYKCFFIYLLTTTDVRTIHL